MSAGNHARDPVELSLAFRWICDNCGEENFAASELAEMTLEDRELAYRKYKELEAWQELPDDWMEFDLVMMPNVVQCKLCNHQFTTKPDEDAFDSFPGF